MRYVTTAKQKSWKWFIYVYEIEMAASEYKTETCFSERATGKTKKTNIRQSFSFILTRMMKYGVDYDLWSNKYNICV